MTTGADPFPAKGCSHSLGISPSAYDRGGETPRGPAAADADEWPDIRVLDGDRCPRVVDGVADGTGVTPARWGEIVCDSSRSVLDEALLQGRPAGGGPQQGEALDYRNC
ncbi:MAG: hypothetical protein ABSC31_13395 [Acidimicrobiales bacterium]